MKPVFPEWKRNELLEFFLYGDEELSIFQRKNVTLDFKIFLLMKKLTYILTACSSILFSCGDSNQFKVEGTVEGAENEKLLFQRSVNGFWITADTIATDGNGQFVIESEAPDYPEIFRVERKGRYVYFPIDSLDRLTLKTDTVSFDGNCMIEGSENALWLAEVDRLSRSLSGKVETDEAFAEVKRTLTERVLQNPSSIVAFYTVEKLVDGRRLYSPLDKNDLKIIGAVATGYQSHRAGNPLTGLLEEEYLAGMRLQPRRTAPKDTLVAEQIGLIDIELKDENGKWSRLSDMAKPGRVVLLNFTSYMAQESPEFNRVLSDIYKKYESKGFGIYQIGYGNNEFDWKDAAKSLPWTTVYDPAGVSSQNLVKYNVTTLPCVFVIGRDGSISERVVDLSNIERAVARQF